MVEPMSPAGSEETSPQHPSPAGSSSSSSSSSSSEAAPPTAPERINQLIQALGPEDPSQKLRVYMGTFSRVLPETAEMQGLKNVADMTRQELAVCIRDAWNQPNHYVGARRVPDEGVNEGEINDIIEKMLVAREEHADGDVHCHVAIRLSRSLRFRPAKMTLLQRHKLASHWSCSHTQFWSAVRYLHIPSENKPAVDGEPFAWAKDGSTLDLFAEAQEPYVAQVWKRRREEKDKAVAAGQGKPKAFTKMDLTAVILDQGLTTKAAVMQYAQDKAANPLSRFREGQQHKRLSLSSTLYGCLGLLHVGS